MLIISTVCKEVKADILFCKQSLILMVTLFFFRYDPGLMEHSELFVTRVPSLEGGALELNILGFMDSSGEENSTAERCYRSHSRSSVLQGLPFGGVPTVLTINVVLWMVQTPTLPPAHIQSSRTIPERSWSIDSSRNAIFPFSYKPIFYFWQNLNYSTLRNITKMSTNY